MKTVILAICLICACMAAGCINISNTSNENTEKPSNPLVVVVGKENFTSIGEALEHAEDGDTVVVYPGVYLERVFLNRSVKFVGMKGAILRPDIESNVYGIAVVELNADNVTVSGFEITLERKTGAFFGLHVKSNNCTVCNCTIHDLNYGIYVDMKTSGTKIHHNLISNNYYGIYLFPESRNVTVYRNIVSNNTFGIRGKGENCKIFENLIFNNTKGIYLCCGSAHNIIYRNNFIDNKVNGQDDRVTNEWSFNGEGNYWYDYDGVDSNGDGIGDTSYYIKGTGYRRDDFPLMQPVNIPDLGPLN